MVVDGGLVAEPIVRIFASQIGLFCCFLEAKAAGRELVLVPLACSKSGVRTKNISPVAACTRCGWLNKLRGQALRDVAEATVKLEDHLQAKHGMAREEANREAQAWGLEVIAKAN
jgi:hypothetical protein